MKTAKTAKPATENVSATATLDAPAVAPNPTETLVAPATLTWEEQLTERASTLAKLAQETVNAMLAKLPEKPGPRDFEAIARAIATSDPATPFYVARIDFEKTEGYSGASPEAKAKRKQAMTVQTRLLSAVRSALPALKAAMGKAGCEVIRKPMTASASATGITKISSSEVIVSRPAKRRVNAGVRV